MAYTVKTKNFNEAKQEILDYRYALLYRLGGILLDRVENLPDINWEECTEARFFSESGELHFFETEGTMEAVEIKNAGGEEDEIIKAYDLAKKFNSQGKKIYVKEYLDYDEDGQAEVAVTRLMRVE